MEQPIPQQESPYEAARRANNALRIGTVAAVRLAAPARCRVQTGGNLTDWLPWLAPRAGGAAGGRVWWPPVVGEQVLLLAPGGDLAQAVVLPGLFSDQMPQSIATEGACRFDFAADAHLEYLPGKHLALRFGDCNIQLTSSAIYLHAPDGGRLTVDKDGAHGTPDVTTRGVSLYEHIHSGVVRGPATSGPPVGGGPTLGGEPGDPPDTTAPGPGPGSGSAGGEPEPMPQWMSEPLEPPASPQETHVLWWLGPARVRYQQPPQDFGTLPVGYHWDFWGGLPLDPQAITEAVFYDRVRPSMWFHPAGRWQGREGYMTFAVSAYDPASERFELDVLKVSTDYIGAWAGTLPAGLYASMPPGPYDAYRSRRTGQIYVNVCMATDWRYVGAGQQRPMAWRDEPRICWRLDEHEWAAHGRPVEPAP